MSTALVLLVLWPTLFLLSHAFLLFGSILISLKCILSEVVLERFAFQILACLKRFRLSFLCRLGEQICVRNRYTLKTSLYCFQESSVSHKISDSSWLTGCFYLFRSIENFLFFLELRSTCGLWSKAQLFWWEKDGELYFYNLALWSKKKTAENCLSSPVDLSEFLLTQRFSLMP